MAEFIVMNSQGGYRAYGNMSIASRLLAHDFDPGAFRPYFGEDHQTPFITLNVNGKKITQLAYNAPTLLRKDEWKMLDDAIMDVAYTTPMRLFQDLRGNGNPIRIPNGMGKTVYEYQRMSDIGPATTSMDGVRKGDNDRLQFDLTGIPLPIVHKDFQYTARQLAVARQGGAPLDTAHARLAARKCLEEVEKYTAGSQTFPYSGYNIYGYTNFPQRMTQTITAPSSSNHGTTISEILSMKKKLTDKGYGGPFMVYMSNAWDLYLDEDFSTTKGENTLRQRILAIDGIGGIRSSYWLTGNTILMVQMTSDVAQAVIGMDIVTMQWPTDGGMVENFKVMCILIPLLRADQNNVTGIVHGS